MGISIRKSFKKLRDKGKKIDREEREFEQKVFKARKEQILRDVEKGKLIPRKNILGRVVFETPQQIKQREVRRQPQPLGSDFDFVGLDRGKKKKKDDPFKGFV